MQLTAAELNAFASKSFIKRAISNPFEIASVLSFFFGVDYQDAGHVDIMRSGSPMNAMGKFWYGGGPEYDSLCKSFVETTRSIGTRDFKGESAWETTVDGKIAQIIVCDQLARNCFRGETEAFAYDHVALDLAKEIGSSVVSHGSVLPSLEGEVYPSYLQFIVLPCMHSENLQDHDMVNSLLAWGKENSPELEDVFTYSASAEKEHRDVLEKFGRYPHRNAKYGRESTEEEMAWLSDVEKLPGWAKSQ